MAKSKKAYFLLKSTASHHSYTIWLDPAIKLELKKYDPIVRKMVPYKQSKAPNPKAS